MIFDMAAVLVEGSETTFELVLAPNGTNQIRWTNFSDDCLIGEIKN